MENIYSETDEYLFLFHKQHCNFFEYINKDIETIYHYTSNETIEKILQTSSLRFTNINNLNDECEFTYLFTVLYDRISSYRYKYSKEFCDNLLDVCLNYCNDKYYFIGENIQKDIERQYYISSFSHSNDNLALWTLYTKDKNFIGCNFGIKIDKLQQESILNGPIFSGSVIYSEKEQIKILDELVASWYHYYETISFDEYFKGDIHDALYKYALFFKHPAFEQEHEYRLIYYPADQQGIQNENDKRYIDIRFNLKNAISNVKLSPTQREKNNIEAMEKIFSNYNVLDKVIEISDIPFRI